MADEVQRNNEYKLIDLTKFLCAYLVIGIHTRPFQSLNILLDKFFITMYQIMRFHYFMHAQDIF